MAEVFARAGTIFGGSFVADTATLSLSGGIPTALVQGLNLSYSQAINRLFEVGSINGNSRVYYVGGRSQGQMGLNRVIGPSNTLAGYYAKFGNPCNAANNTLEFGLGAGNCGSGFDGAAGVSYNCKFCVITQVGVSVSAQEMVINENSALMFSGLDYSGN